MYGFLCIFHLYFFVIIGVAKFRHITLKTPRQMTREEYEKLPPKNNGMPEVKLRTSSNLDESNPLAMLYGKVTKHNETACKVINYGLLSNKVVVSN